MTCNLGIVRLSQAEIVRHTLLELAELQASRLNDRWPSCSALALR